VNSNIVYGLHKKNTKNKKKRAKIILFSQNNLLIFIALSSKILSICIQKIENISKIPGYFAEQANPASIPAIM